jgi:hypothetical protein
VSATETDVMLRSLGSGNESVAGKFPFYAPRAVWLPDQSAVAYTVPVPPDNGSYPNGGLAVHLYAHQQDSLLVSYPIPAIDCICRFGLAPQILAFSPDGQYLVEGWPIGGGAGPVNVYRVSDRTIAKVLDPTVGSAFWDKVGHRLFMGRRPSDAEQTWTPEGGVTSLTGAAGWQFLAGQSPDGVQVAYTAYTDPATLRQLRAYVYDLKAGTTQLLIDKLRSQVLFVKDGWVWYLEEAACDPTACAAPWGTDPTGKVFAMRLPSGAETEVTFAAGENPVVEANQVNSLPFGPGEFWPAS